MKTRLFILCTFSLIAFSSCKKDNLEEPAQAAENYFNYIIESDLEKYVAGMARYGSLPEPQRKETLDLVRQYVNREKNERGGMKSVTVVETSTEGDTANVLLAVTYGNETVEEILLPLVKIDGIWRLI